MATTPKHRHAHDISELYALGKELGKGGFAVVHVGVDKKDKSEWAVKMIAAQVFQKNREMMAAEVGVMQSLNHNGVVHLREVVETPKYFCIVMELLTGRELFDRIVEREKYSENDAKGIARELLQTIAYVHAQRVVHRDLKPENLIFKHPGEDSPLKLTDFGFAAFLIGSKRLTQGCGTPEYVAPEVLDQKPYTEKVDMWSVGVIIYILLCGFPPFHGDSDDELFDRICSCNFKFYSPYWDPISETAKDLIRKLLTLSPEKRLSAEEALHHPWLTEAPKPSVDLASTRLELQRFNAIRKLRKGVILVVATNKIRLVLGRKQS